MKQITRPLSWLTYRKNWLVFLLVVLVVGSYRAGFGQDRLPITPVPEEAKQAVTFNLAGNTPFMGVSYHHQLIKFATQRQPYAGAIEVSAGVGFVPAFCFFGCTKGVLTTQHALLLLWGRKLQGELGYAGFLTSRESFYNQGYLPGAVAGLRYAPKTWLLRLYMAGMVYQDKGTGITASGDLAWQTTTYLLPIPGVSIGRRF